MATPILLAWSGGKDSTLALDRLRQDDRYEVVALLTTITREYDRVSMHGVRRSLLEAQAAALGYPLVPVFIPANASNQAYEAAMQETLTLYRARGVQAVAFGDIFLADIRRYREERLAAVGLRGLFPLWDQDTRQLAAEFLARGFRAVICCVDSQALDGRLVGREFDAAFLADLPPGVDPCGENGEFHSFVYAGPLFRWPVALRRGAVVVREQRFVYCDLLPAGD